MNLKLGPAVASLTIYDGIIDADIVLHVVDGLPAGERAYLATVRGGWKFIRATHVQPRWTGDYAGAEDALEALGRDVIRTYIRGIVSRNDPYRDQPAATRE
jgi:hypothetical protein